MGFAWSGLAWLYSDWGLLGGFGSCSRVVGVGVGSLCGLWVVGDWFLFVCFIWCSACMGCGLLVLFVLFLSGGFVLG